MPEATESTEPVDVEARLADPKSYEDTILRIYAKKSLRGSAFGDVGNGVTYFSTATDRKGLAKAIARTVASGEFEPEPVDLWILEDGAKSRAAHKPTFIDHVVGSTLYRLLSHNARCNGLPGVYSYLPGMTNLGAMRTFAGFVRDHRRQAGPKGRPLHVLQSDFDGYGDNLRVGPHAPLWPILREIADLGSPSGEIGARTWDLIVSLVRPVVRDEDGILFTRFKGMAMGTAIVPLLGNIAVVPMDKAISSIDGIFYARYNDDFIVAHSDIDALHEADARIDSLVDALGVKRKLSKELRTALSATGQASTEDPAYRGRDRIDCLGLTVTSAGTVAVGPHRLRRFAGRVATRIDAAAAGVMSLPLGERARHLVAATNVMLDVKSPFSVAGLPSLLEATTDRGVLKDLDYRIARKIVQVATRSSGVRGFRELPPAVLRGDMGLVSLVHLKNLQ